MGALDVRSIDQLVLDDVDERHSMKAIVRDTLSLLMPAFDSEGHCAMCTP